MKQGLFKMFWTNNMHVKITDMNKDKAQVLLNSDIFVEKVIFKKKMVLQLLFKTLYFINVADSFWKWIPDPGALAGKGTLANWFLILSLGFLTRRNPLLSVTISLAGINFNFYLDSEAQGKPWIHLKHSKAHL